MDVARAFVIGLEPPCAGGFEVTVGRCDAPALAFDKPSRPGCTSEPILLPHRAGGRGRASAWA